MVCLCLYLVLVRISQCFVELRWMIKTDAEDIG